MFERFTEASSCPTRRLLRTIRFNVHARRPIDALWNFETCARPGLESKRPGLKQLTLSFLRLLPCNVVDDFRLLSIRDDDVTRKSGKSNDVRSMCLNGLLAAHVSVENHEFSLTSRRDANDAYIRRSAFDCIIALVCGSDRAFDRFRRVIWSKIKKIYIEYRVLKPNKKKKKKSNNEPIRSDCWY